MMTMIGFLVLFALPLSCAASWASFFIFYKNQLSCKWNTGLTVALCLIPMTIIVVIYWHKNLQSLIFFLGK